MKKLFLLLFAVFMVLTACSKSAGNDVTRNDYTFSGESDNWKAEYNYKGMETWGEDDGVKTYTNKDGYTFKLTYKGALKELASVEELEYAFETKNSSGFSTRELTDDPPNKLTFTSKGASEGGAKVSEDEVIQVNVKWDEHEEEFELHNMEK